VFELAAIKWNLSISLDITDPAKAKASVTGGSATCYPAHIVKPDGLAQCAKVRSYSFDSKGRAGSIKASETVNGECI
jgi:hypothetical protein